MATDPDQTSYFGYLLAMLFGGGGAAKLVTHEGRIKSLEGSRNHHSEQLEKIGTTVAALDERSKQAQRDREEILGLLRERR